MDFELDEELRAIQGTFARFADERILPRAEELDQAHEFPHEIFKAVAELGFFKPDDIDLSAVAKNVPTAQRIFNEVGWE